MSRPREELVRYWAGVNAYRDKEPAVPQPPPAPPEPDDDGVALFAFEIGQRVRMADAVDGTVGRVVRLIVDPGESMYVVTWSDTRCTTTHYDFELADAEPAE